MFGFLRRRKRRNLLVVNGKIIDLNNLTFSPEESLQWSVEIIQDIRRRLEELGVYGDYLEPHNPATWPNYMKLQLSKKEKKRQMKEVSFLHGAITNHQARIKKLKEDHPTLPFAKEVNGSSPF